MMCIIQNIPKKKRKSEKFVKNEILTKIVSNGVPKNTMGTSN